MIYRSYQEEKEKHTQDLWRAANHDIHRFHTQDWRSGGLCAAQHGCK
jgi:predicted alpha/beta hydrolase family esterase